jgi:hypothetical protein
MYNNVMSTVSTYYCSRAISSVQRSQLCRASRIPISKNAF